MFRDDWAESENRCLDKLYRMVMRMCQEVAGILWEAHEFSGITGNCQGTNIAKKADLPESEKAARQVPGAQCNHSGTVRKELGRPPLEDGLPGRIVVFN